MSWWNPFSWGSDNSVPSMSPAYRQYGQQLQGLAQNYNPYRSMGMGASQAMGREASSLWNDPNALQNRIAAGYKESPFESNILKEVTQRMNDNAANTGMLGTYSANNALQNQLMNQMGQFENQYINRGMSSAYHAFPMQQYLGGMGYNALGNYSNLMNQAYAAPIQGMQQDIASKLAQQRDQNNLFSNIGSLGAGIAGMFL